MDSVSCQRVAALAGDLGSETVDITGGAPEMHPDFRRFVERLRELDLQVIVRTNLTILLEPGYEDLPQFFRRHGVELVASLPLSKWKMKGITMRLQIRSLRRIGRTLSSILLVSLTALTS